MTTVSVQPMKSEPNEREAFERVLSNLDFIDFANSMSVKELIRLGFHEAWQHQQNRIETHIAINKSLLMQRDTLQAKLNVAVEGLKYFQTFSNGAGTATAILENIEKIGE